MPFASKLQQRMMFAKHPRIAKRWAKHTSNIRDLPERAPKDESPEKITGGIADQEDPSQFDQEELFAGIQVEFEHTDDVMTAMEIAMDHLVEIPDYYTRLLDMEDEADIEGIDPSASISDVFTFGESEEEEDVGGGGYKHPMKFGMNSMRVGR